jgi:hypothetical protein
LIYKYLLLQLIFILLRYDEQLITIKNDFKRK